MSEDCFQHLLPPQRMEEFGQAVSAAERVDGPWRQLRPPSGDTLPAEPHLVTHKLPLTIARAEALGGRCRYPPCMGFPGST